MPPINNTSKLLELLHYLSEEQCAWAIGVLRKRLQEGQRPAKITSPDTCIESLGLSVRACNALYRNNLYTVQDVLDYGLDRLRLLRHTGAKTAQEIKAAIERVQEEALHPALYGQHPQPLLSAKAV